LIPAGYGLNSLFNRITMKYLSYILSLMLLALLSACNDDSMPDISSPDLPEGAPVDMIVGAEFPESFVKADSRAMGEQPTLDDLNINLFVFDASGVMLQFIEPKDISIKTIVSSTNTVTFVVHNIYSSTMPRRLHFVVTSAPDLLELDGGEYISAMASETTVMPALLTSGNTDAYWGMSVLNDGIDEKTNVGVKMIRNFVKVSVKSSAPESTFKMLGYTVVNRPNRGAVAPYIYKDHLFASFLSPADVLLSYDDLITQGYHGVNPAGSETDMLCTTEEEVAASLADSERRLAAGESDTPSDTPYYFYERSQSYITSMGSDVAVTYVIVKGQYMGKTYYYKIDIGHDSEGKFKFYDLLRNFCYMIDITEVGGAGAASLLEAMNGPAHNNVSASVVTRDLFSIGYDNEIIVVSATNVIFTEKTVDYELQFRYTLPDNAAIDTSKLKIYDLNNESVEYNMDDVSTTTSKSIDLDGEVVESASLSLRTDGWYTLRITTKDIPDDSRRFEQNLRIYYSGSAGLGRTVTLMLRKPWNLSDVSHTDLTDAMENDFTVNFTLPSGMAHSQFPLILTFESDKQNIYAKNGSKMTVAIGKSGFKGATTDNVMLYEWRMEWEDYNDAGGGTYTAHFRTNTTSTEDWKYHTEGIDAVANGDRTKNNRSADFCIRIANKGLKCIEPHYVNIDRPEPNDSQY